MLTQNDYSKEMKSTSTETWQHVTKHFNVTTNGTSERTVPIPASDKRVQQILRGSGLCATEPCILAQPWPLATYTPDQDVIQNGCLPQIWHSSHGTTLDLLGNGNDKNIAPTNNTTASRKFVQGEVREELSQTLHGATWNKIDTVSRGSEEQVDQFWQSGANNHGEVWADQFFDEEEEYFNSMSTHTAGQFDPDYQLMGGWMNTTSSAPSIGLFSRWHVMPAAEIEKLKSFTGDYNNNAFEDCQHQDTFLRYIYAVFWDDTEFLIEFDQPMIGMSVPYEAFHASFNGKCPWEQALAEQQIEFDMLSEPVVTFVADANGKTVSMATTLILVNKIQGVPCSHMMKVLFDSGKSASMISSKVLPKGVQINHDGPTNLVSTLAGAIRPVGKVGVQGLWLSEFDKGLVIDKHNFLIFNADCKYETITRTQQTAFLESHLLEIKNDEWYDHSNDGIESYTSTLILDAKYERADIDSVIEENCSHLLYNQRLDLATILRKNEKLFDGSLVHYPHDKMHIDLKPNAQPAYQQHHPIANTHKDTSKKELDNLVKIGVLSKRNDPTTWRLPIFAIPKKEVSYFLVPIRVLVP